MKKIITCGSHSVSLDYREHRAMLITDERTLPVELADVLNDSEGIQVDAITRNDSGRACVLLAHGLPASGLIDEVCDAMTRVFDNDTTVANARLEEDER